MESTTSVSKGVFLFHNGFKKHKKNVKAKSKDLFETMFIQEPWYKTYKSNWNLIEKKIKDIHHTTYSLLLNDIVNYIKSFHGYDEFATTDTIIPSATLLTGVNQPDHVSQFTALVEKIRYEVTPHIAMIQSQDAPTLKYLVENAVWQLIYGYEALDTFEDEDSDEVSSVTNKKLRKSQCTMRTLQKWYHTKYISPKKKKHDSTRSLVIIIPDFESFNCTVLQDFVMIISSYVSSLPIIFVFGVATSVSALHKSFPYHVSSKLLIKVFHSHSSAVYMNQVLEEIFLTHSSPLHLSGKAFELLTDVFLFYDLSVTGLLQSIKYCMMEHYYGDNIKSLCCERQHIEETVMNLSQEDLLSMRHLLSFRFVAENLRAYNRVKIFNDDNFLREVLCKEMNKLHDYLYCFYTCVRLLSVFVKDLPRNLLGKSVREIYTKCTLNCVTSSQYFKECMQLLNFQSQVKLVENIKNGLKLMNSALQVVSPIKPLRSSPKKNSLNNILLDDDLGENFAKSVTLHLRLFLRQIENANTESLLPTNDSSDEEMKTVSGNRYKLMENLFRSTRVEKIQSEFEMIRARFVSYLEEMFARGLQPPHAQPFHEIFFFSDVAGVKKQIVGSPRGALHTGLSNPVHYLQCSCCHLESADSASDTLPDVCLAYKLHRECGKFINLYDWLQSFMAVLQPTADDEQRHYDAGLQARFTRAVTELQFLGFIKSSKRKTDHVMRLTW